MTHAKITAELAPKKPRERKQHKCLALPVTLRLKLDITGLSFEQVALLLVKLGTRIAETGALEQTLRSDDGTVKGETRVTL